MPIATPEQIKAATDEFLKRHMSADGLSLRVNSMSEGCGHIVSALLEGEGKMRLEEDRLYHEIANVRYVG